MQIMNVNSWDAFKTLITAKKLLMQYSDMPTTYDVFGAEDKAFLWSYSILKGSEEATDFENNFKDDANQPLEIKATSTGAQRVAPTSQPADTTEKWKGYHAEMTTLETTKTILINFPVDVFLRGGFIFSENCDSEDYFTVDVVWTDYPATVIYPNLLEEIHMMAGTCIPFVSAECMKFPTMLSLQITYYKKNDLKTRSISAVADFYEPPQL